MKSAAFTALLRRCCLPVASLLLASNSPVDAADMPFRPMALFSDDMVLQRDIPAPVWGTASAGDTIQAEFAGQRKTTTAGADGKWRITLDPLATSSTPRQLRLHSALSGRTVTLDRILVGEVWICSGQSNMEMPVGNPYRPDVYPGVMDFQQEIAAADHPQIRMILVEHQASAAPAPDVPTPGWQICSPTTVPRFSAAGYFFARHLQQHLNVPVGMISAAWSATSAEAWSPPSALRGIPKFARVLDKRANAPDVRREDPAALFNGMIAPLIPCAIRGVIWYQGENNVKSADDYRKLLPALIRGWREEWALPPPLRAGAPGGDFPFLFVQLAGYGGKPKKPVENGWANLREAQSMALGLANTGMAVAIDIGDAKRIHPPNKQEVGKRLGLLARAIAYGGKIEASGPVYQSMRIDRDTIRLTFNQPRLIAKGGPPTGFAIAGEDRQWHSAHAEIIGSEVVVSSPQVPQPLAARYGWANHPDCNLYNPSALPVPPFRTDP